MIKIQGKIPRSVGVAVSGGVDSMAVLDFLSQNHDVTVYNFNHGTHHSHKAALFLDEYCYAKGLPLQLGHLSSSKPNDKSWEEYWRDERYEWLTSFDRVIVLGHHLDDCVESYVFNMCHGKSHTIPYNHANCIRPFRLNKKKELRSWAENHNVPWVEDESNENLDFNRNYIRAKVIPELLMINPGLHKVIFKKIKASN